jgi:hypothetical protein
MSRPVCNICGKTKKEYKIDGETVWKCTTSPADHAKQGRINQLRAAGEAGGAKTKKGKFSGVPFRKPKPKK